MNHLLLYRASGAVLIVCATLGIASFSGANAADLSTTAETIKQEVRQIVAGLNAHDVAKATMYDADKIVAMQCGSPPVTGAEADRAGFKEMFANDPAWKARLIEETIDVSNGGDMAVYRGSYHEDGSRAGVAITHKTIFLAEFKRQSNGAWEMVWYSISNMEASHPK
jgi:ketosteroid isomerase-like protein